MEPAYQIANVRRRLGRLWNWARLAAVLLVARVTIGVVAGYVDYFPPNFYSEFLTGRKSYFYGLYQIAFGIHIIFSPLVIFSGMWLLSGSRRRRYPTFHRRLGRVHVLIVLCCVAPSGLWMSYYASTGAWAGCAFALSSCATFVCAWMGWRSVMARQFREHQVWMSRCYLLLCSAVVLRVLSGAATVLGSEQIWTYPVFAWISTLLPVIVYEVWRSRSING